MKKNMTLRALLSRRTKGILAATLIALTSLPNIAWAGTAEATVSNNVVRVGDAFQLTISVDESVDSDELNLAVLDKSFVYGRPNVSNSTQFINGDMSRSTVWRVAVAAKESGTFTVPSFDIDGMKTAPITIKVLAANDKSTQVANSAVEVQASVDRDKGYIGESFIYRARLLIGTRVDSPSLQAPFGDGLDVTLIGEDSQSESVINGRRYVVIDRQYQITPTKAGALTLEGAVFTGSEVKGSGWGASVGLPISRQAKSVTLNVKDKPAGYKGLWLPTSSLALSQRWDPDTLGGEQSAKVGEPINRVISLSIANTAQSAMPNLTITYPNQVRVYSDKPEYTQQGDATVMTLKQVIIPREEGKVDLPAVSINWFNTQTGKQETAKISGLALNVQPGDITTQPSPALPELAAQVPAAPSEQITTAVTTAGYWPWTTGVFALLWLITLAMYIRKPQVATNNVRSEKALPTQAEKGLAALVDAVKANNAVKVSSTYRAWNRSALPEDLQRAIEAEINAMMASCYSATSGKWENATLLSLLAKAAKVKPHDTPTQGLAELK
ncbi:BatD family protein [Enterovibrio sp. ZSDZ35]|uniref:BatD family protein n=1 Tax=Enterovibrio qingdaonensis TaxID=2899818 RepID=A0ABT5QMA4_9GAMM|nr:BatD family protein [Enterovibrio sp. ZSDZ35]MDD1781426.1 BatD family protein [Enterovibrio sp. ZSDZ35]